MNRTEIEALFRDLARSQGSYGRLLENITEEGYAFLEAQNFTDPVDLILYLEG